VRWNDRACLSSSYQIHPIRVKQNPATDAVLSLSKDFTDLHGITAMMKDSTSNEAKPMRNGQLC
jgi:hypothetical protein